MAGFVDNSTVSATPDSLEYQLPDFF